MLHARPRAVLFDYDDTLVRTRQCKFAAMQALARRHYSFQLTDEPFEEPWCSPYRELFTSLFARADADVERVVQRYEELTDEFPLDAHPEALHVLGTLSAGLPVGIVTAAGRQIATSQLRQLGVALERLTVFQ